MNIFANQNDSSDIADVSKEGKSTVRLRCYLWANLDNMTIDEAKQRVKISIFIGLLVSLMFFLTLILMHRTRYVRVGPPSVLEHLFPMIFIFGNLFGLVILFGAINYFKVFKYKFISSFILNIWLPVLLFKVIYLDLIFTSFKIIF